VLIGPGGAGKGTVAERLVREVPRLWLSRSWTTRQRRPGEAEDAYVFVDREKFRAHAAAGGFLEWADYLGQLMGTPVPTPPDGHDVLLEIDLEGARQVRALRPDAVVVLLVPPSMEVQEARLRARGDREEHVRRRLAKGEEEVRLGQELADAVIVNDDLLRATADVAAIVDRTRGGQVARSATPA